MSLKPLFLHYKIKFFIMLNNYKKPLLQILFYALVFGLPLYYFNKGMSGLNFWEFIIFGGCTYLILEEINGYAKELIKN